MYSVMWSEHCSYKSSKVHLRQFGDKKPETDALLVGIGENAGVVDIGDGWAVTFKVESHNHPSYVEPYQGAATGVGGIVRDIMSMGARPVAVMDPLRFGAADHPDTRRVLPGVVAGVGGYGNCLGLPNIGGEVVFDASYQGNPLVNALCVGVMRHDEIHLASARGVGNLVILYGARTGGDGIGGVSVLASETFDATAGPTKRPSVQVGDPFMEKLLIECTLEVLARRPRRGHPGPRRRGHLVRDLRAGLQRRRRHARRLDRVLAARPHAHAGGDPHERVAGADVRGRRAGQGRGVPGDLRQVGRRGRHHRRGQRLRAADRRLARRADRRRPPAHRGPRGPGVRPPAGPPEWLTPRQDDAPTPERLARPSTAAEIRETLLTLFASPNLAAKDWVTDQYDRYVLGNTVLAQPEDSGMIRIDDETGLGVALATDCNGRFAALDPYAGAQLAFAEAYRNVVGLRCGAAGDHQLPELRLAGGPGRDVAVRAGRHRPGRRLPDAWAPRSPAATSRSTTRPATWPSTRRPSSACSACIDDVARRTPMAWGPDGDLIYVLGETRDEFGGSEWAHVVHNHLGGMPPHLDLEAERQLGQILVAGSRDGMFTAAHDVSDGGLAVALVEMALRSDVGARCWVPDGLDPFVFLLAESATRAVVVVARSEELRFTEMCAARGFPATRIGVVDSGIGAESGVRRRAGAGRRRGARRDRGAPLAEVRALREATLPALFG